MYNKVEICGVNTSRLPVLSSSEKKELLKRTKQGDTDAREKLIDGNLRLVLSIIQRFAGRGGRRENLDDLFQVGCIGLIKAVDGFDMDKMVEFSTYAVPVITGEIKRFLRDDGAIKVSRAVRSNFVRIRACTEKLRNLLGRDPTVSELVEKTGLTLEEVVEALDSAARPASLDETLSDDGDHTLADTVAGGDFSADLEKIALRQGIGKLCAEDRKLITLRYFCSKTQQQTAEMLGMSQVQVSRREKKILEKLKEYV